MRECQRIRGVSAPVQIAAWQLRDHMTASEEALWLALRGRWVGGLKFRHQHPVGRFVLDFYCPAIRLAIEIDGKVHDQLKLRDAERSNVLSRHGISVLRFMSDDIELERPQVIANIRRAAEAIRNGWNLPP